MRQRAGVWLVMLLAINGCDGDESGASPSSDAGGGGGGGSVTDDGGTTPVDAGGGSTCSPRRVDDETVATTTGTYTGAKTGNARAWKGIRYAAPPVGALRWKVPTPAECTPEERSATAYGPKCPQMNDGAVVGEEDCLTLNIWSPDGATDAPVLVFLHGGGNVTGSASDPLYDGASLAARTSSVVVTVEYRLGALGFLVHPSLDAERAEKVSGNYGLLDQIEALRWVQANVASFGGAASKVLLFGESAGAQDTLVHVVSPLSKNLFRAAAVQSGGFYKTTLSDAETAHAAVVADLGCGAAPDVLACLRALPFDALARIDSAVGPFGSGAVRFGPVVDGWAMPHQGLDAIAKGAHNRVPLIIGTNAEETSRMMPKVADEQQYAAAVTKQYGSALANKLIGQYPALRFGTPQRTLVRLTTDVTWTCPARRIARALASAQSEPVHRYYFTWRPAGPAGAAIGATHGIELPFVFGNFQALASGFTPGESETNLSAAMGELWSTIAGAGKPTIGGASTWPAYDVATDPYLEISGVAPEAKTALAAADCDFIDALAGSP